MGRKNAVLYFYLSKRGSIRTYAVLAFYHSTDYCEYFLLWWPLTSPPLQSRGRLCCRYWLPFLSLTLSDFGMTHHRHRVTWLSHDISYLPVDHMFMSFSWQTPLNLQCAMKDAPPSSSPALSWPCWRGVRGHRGARSSACSSLLSSARPSGASVRALQNCWLVAPPAVIQSRTQEKPCTCGLASFKLEQDKFKNAFLSKYNMTPCSLWPSQPFSAYSSW